MARPLPTRRAAASAAAWLGPPSPEVVLVSQGHGRLAPRSEQDARRREGAAMVVGLDGDRRQRGSDLPALALHAGGEHVGGDPEAGAAAHHRLGHVLAVDQDPALDGGLVEHRGLGPGSGQVAADRGRHVIPQIVGVQHLDRIVGGGGVRHGRVGDRVQRVVDHVRDGQVDDRGAVRRCCQAAALEARDVLAHRVDVADRCARAQQQLVQVALLLEPDAAGGQGGESGAAAGEAGEHDVARPGCLRQPQQAQRGAAAGRGSAPGGRRSAARSGASSSGGSAWATTIPSAMASPSTSSRAAAMRTLALPAPSTRIRPPRPGRWTTPSTTTAPFGPRETISRTTGAGSAACRPASTTSSTSDRSRAGPRETSAARSGRTAVPAALIPPSGLPLQSSSDTGRLRPAPRRSAAAGCTWRCARRAPARRS